MIIKLKIFLILFLTSTIAFAQNHGGLGAYAAMHKDWPCKVMMRTYNGSSQLRLSVLWNTFGKNFSCLDQWAADGRAKYLQVHLINEVCQRNKRCGDYELLANLTTDQYRAKLLANFEPLYARIRANLKPMAEWLHAHPTIRCALSGGLESNLNRQAYLNLVAAIKPMFPERCEWVWNPVNNNRYGTNPIPGYIMELHGVTPSLQPQCIANMDGVDADLPARPAIVVPNVPYSELPRFIASLASCDATFLWIAEFNGIDRGGFKDPRKRTNWPTNAIADQLARQLTTEVEPVPPWTDEDDKAKRGCETFLKVPDGAKKNFLWKQSEPAVLGRGAVTFLPTKYNKQVFKKEDVYVMKRSSKIATSYEQNRYTEDGSNRHFFRFRKKAEDFPYNVVVHYGKICAVLSNPKIRID